MTEAVSAASVPAPPARLGLGIGADGTYTRFAQVAAFVLGLITTFVFIPLTVIAALLYTRAEARFPSDPARARTLVNWSWLCITLFPLLVAVAIAGVAVLISVLTG